MIMDSEKQLLEVLKMQREELYNEIREYEPIIKKHRIALDKYNLIAAILKYYNTEEINKNNQQ